MNRNGIMAYHYSTIPILQYSYSSFHFSNIPASIIPISPFPPFHHSTIPLFHSLVP